MGGSNWSLETDRLEEWDVMVAQSEPILGLRFDYQGVFL